MKDIEIISYIESLFDTTTLPMFKEEVGQLNSVEKDIQTIGYCTNVTLDVIEKAKANKVDFLLTHHDAWDFIYGLKEQCTKALKEADIAHYFIHLPLDDVDFGTNDSLLKAMNLKKIKETANEDGFYCGRVAEYENPMTFEDHVKQVETVLGEPVRAWKFNDRLVKRVGLVCGGGGLTPEVKMAVDHECDVYITGEKVLYTIEYAELESLNLIVGSHTFTEIFGVESLALKVQEQFKVNLIKIDENRLEATEGIFIK